MRNIFWMNSINIQSENEINRNWNKFLFMLWQTNTINSWQIDRFRCRPISIDRIHDRQMWLALHRWCNSIVWHALTFPFGRHNLLTHTSIWAFPIDVFCTNETIQLNQNNLVSVKFATSNLHRAKPIFVENSIRRHRHCQGIVYRIQYRNYVLVAI